MWGGRRRGGTRRDGRRGATRGLPEGWRAVVARSVGLWHGLDPDERERLGRLADDVLRSMRWEAARGFRLTDDMRVVIAAQAGLLLLGLDGGVDWYRDVTSIVVHPTTVVMRGERPGPVPGVFTDAPLPIHGQANDRRGPVLIAWDKARADARHPGTGHNLVLHEFAHKLDMLDGIVDGTPPLPDRDARHRWVVAFTEAFEALRARRRPTPLDRYGATNPAEFFAVATEAFFDAPRALRDHEPALYEALRAFYRQDPAIRPGPGPAALLL